MSLIRPFAGLRPTSNHANDVAAPPYDVLNSSEAKLQAAGKPWSFLHISKPEIDLPEGTDVYAEEVYLKGLENFNKMIDQKILQKDSQPCYYFYRLIMGDHQQTGLVAVASVKDYDSNRIRKHEYTRPDKEDDRVRQIDTLNAQTGPVFLTYRHHELIDNMVERVLSNKADIDITTDDGIQHALWVVDSASDILLITQTFDQMDAIYIADGHHRSAAASRVASMRHAANPQQTQEQSHDYFLSVLFPDNQMKILDYNRVISDLNGHDTETLLEKIAMSFQVTKSDTQYKPVQSTEFGMYLEGQWYQLKIHPSLIPQHDPVKQLDVSLLADYLIEPILGISDPRRDKRIDFVGGIRGLKELERRVDSKEMAIAFALYPTTMSQLMSVADANEVMPPKSTWFEPKLADGLVSHLLD
jgi:uncharacterized protein (DUF1015 family)